MSDTPTILPRPPGLQFGDLLPGFGYGRCFGCHRPWWAATGHTVWHAMSVGQFALCVRCWDDATTEGRLAAHRWVCDHTATGPKRWPEIRNAIQSGDCRAGWDIEHRGE